EGLVGRRSKTILTQPLKLHTLALHEISPRPPARNHSLLLLLWTKIGRQENHRWLFTNWRRERVAHRRNRIHSLRSYEAQHRPALLRRPAEAGKPDQSPAHL